MFLNSSIIVSFQQPLATHSTLTSSSSQGSQRIRSGLSLHATFYAWISTERNFPFTTQPRRRHSFSKTVHDTQFLDHEFWLYFDWEDGVWCGSGHWKSFSLCQCKWCRQPKAEETFNPLIDERRYQSFILWYYKREKNFSTFCFWFRFSQRVSSTVRGGIVQTWFVVSIEAWSMQDLKLEMENSMKFFRISSNRKHFLWNFSNSFSIRFAHIDVFQSNSPDFNIECEI